MSAKRLTVWTFGSEVDRRGAFAAIKQLTSPDKPCQPSCAPRRPAPTSLCFTASLDASLFICRSVASPIQSLRSPALVHAHSLAFAWLPLPRRLLRSGFFGLRLPHGSTTTCSALAARKYMHHENIMSKVSARGARDGAHTSIV